MRSLAEPMTTHTRGNAYGGCFAGRGRWLQRKDAGGGLIGSMTSDSHCAKQPPLGDQMKLFISQGGDEGEREADRIAELVAPMAEPEPRASQATNAPLARRRASGSPSAIGAAPALVAAGLSVPSYPLDARTHGYFAARFGHDFSAVRVHADGPAAASAAALNARAYTVGNDVVFGAGEYRPATASGRRLLAHELVHVAQQSAASGPPLVQRSPIFPDDSCAAGKIQEKLTGYVATALELVRQTNDRLAADPVQLATPLRRFFHFDPTIPGQLRAAPTVLPTLRRNLANLETELSAPTLSRCETGPDMRGARGMALVDAATGQVLHDEGIFYNRHSLQLITLPRQIVNTILHEYGHLAGIGHHEAPGEPINNEDSTQVRGLTTREALNNAESYMRFIRAATGEPLLGSARRQPAPAAGEAKGAAESAGENAAPSCAALDELVPPRFAQAEAKERAELENYYPELHGACFRILRGGDDSCFGYCLHRAAGGDPLGKGVNLPIPPTIEEFEQAFAQYYQPIALAAVDSANPPADAVLALFARGETPTHVACRSELQYQGQYLWESKVSPVFPLILHDLGDLEGGAAGDVVKFYRIRSAQGSVGQ